MSAQSRRFRAVLALSLLVGATALASAARAAFPGSNGRIVFASNRNGNFDLFSVNPDGSGITQLTTSTADDVNPDVSPDGTKIAFASMRDGNYEIYTMGINGASPTRLTNNSVPDLDPAWSPSGTKIAFTRAVGSNFDIFTMNANGTGAVDITNSPSTNGAPAWSPDGTKIAFTTNRDGNFEIYSMGANGASPKRLTNDPNVDEQPDWSPDGTHIVFDSNRFFNDYDIFRIQSDGTGLTQLTAVAGDETFPAYSPDGTKIVYDVSAGDNKQLVVGSSTGTSSPQAVTDNQSVNIDGNWGPHTETLPSPSPSPSRSASSPPPSSPPPTGTPIRPPPSATPSPTGLGCKTTYEGWFEPVQAVWQDDRIFPDKATKQFTELDPRDYNAELSMISNKATVLYGVDYAIKHTPRGDVKVDKSRHVIVIKGKTTCQLQASKGIHFTLTQGAGNLDAIVAPIKGSKVPKPSKPGDERTFSVTLDVRTPVGVPPTPFTFTAAGPYTIQAEALDADGNPTGLIVTVSGKVVDTFMPSVHFVPTILTDASAKADAARKLQTTSNSLEQESDERLADYYPIATGTKFGAARNLIINNNKNGDGDLRTTQATAAAKFQQIVNQLPVAKHEAKAQELRREEPVAEMTRQLGAGGILAGAGRVIGVLNNNDFERIAPTETDDEGQKLVPQAVAASKKVIFVRGGAAGVDHWTVAHELAHTFPYLWTGSITNDKGQETANPMVRDCNLDFHNSLAPVARGLRVTQRGVNDRMLISDKTKSIMSRASAQPRWIDQCTYWHLADVLQQRQDPQMVLVQGAIARLGRAKSGELLPSYEIDGQADLVAGGHGLFSLVERDASGASLGTFSFSPIWQLEDSSINRLIETFTDRIPEMPGLASIDLNGPKGRLDTIAYSAHAPTVTITAPQNGASVALVNGTAYVSWTGTDADSDPLLYTVLFSPDGGTTWIPTAFEQTATSWEVPVYGGSDCVVKVIATDGLRTTAAEVHFTPSVGTPTP